MDTLDNLPAAGTEDDQEAQMLPLTPGIRIELAFMALLTFIRVVTLPGSLLLLSVWFLSEDAFWLMASVSAMVGYAASTLIFEAMARRAGRAADRRNR